jgi:hypothetical protein
MKVKYCQVCYKRMPSSTIKRCLHTLKHILLDRIPRPAYMLCLDGMEGYVIFHKSEADEERKLSIEEDGEDLVTLKRIWISPAKLATLPEFVGW